MKQSIINVTYKSGTDPSAEDMNYDSKLTEAFTSTGPRDVYFRMENGLKPYNFYEEAKRKLNHGSKDIK
jgi:hypothetical protein